MVEIGCGPLVKEIVETDVSAKMIEIAQQKAADARVPNVEFQPIAVDGQEFPDNSQDVVLGLTFCICCPTTWKKRCAQRTRGSNWVVGVFVTSTPCIGDRNAILKIAMNTILPMGQFLGLFPSIAVFTKIDLENSFRNKGFDVEYEWQPDKKDSAVFIIGRKSRPRPL